MFWLGVRSSASAREFGRFTRSSYGLLLPPGLASKANPARTVSTSTHATSNGSCVCCGSWASGRCRRLISWRSTLTRRDAASHVVGADDAFRDAVVALHRKARIRPEVFVNTSWVGKPASWGYHEPVADTHACPTSTKTKLRDEFAGLQDLRAHLPDVAPLLAYPYGCTTRACARL